MASIITGRIAKHVLKENAKNHFGTEDPYFDYITPHDLNGNPRKAKRTKKAAPPGLTSAETKILKKVTRRAYRLDNCFNVCGIRVGWSAIFGIIPGLGDVFDVLMALMVYRTCCQAEIPSALRAKMMMNIMLDFMIGLVPILGDVADAVFRANTRNASLLYGHLRERGAERVQGGVTGGAIADVGAVETREERKGSVLTDGGKTHVHGNGHGNGYTNGHANGGGLVTKEHVKSPVHDNHTLGQTSGTVVVDSAADQHQVQSPQHTKTKSAGKGGWLSRLTGTSETAPVSKKEADLEAGERI